MQFYAILLLHFSHFEFRNLLKPFCSGHRQPVPLRQCLPLCLCIWPFYTFSRKSLKVLLCPHNSNAIALFHVNCCFPFVYPIFPSLSVVALTHLAQHISIRQRRRRLESESPDVTQGVEFTNKSVFQKCGNWKKSSGYIHTHVYIYIYIHTIYIYIYIYIHTMYIYLHIGISK